MRLPSKDFLILLNIIEATQKNSPFDFYSDLGKINTKIFKITKDEFSFLKEELQETIDYLNESLAKGILFEDMGFFEYSLDKIEFDENTHLFTVDYVANDCKETTLILRFRLN